MTEPSLTQRLAADLGEQFAVEREIARGGMAVVYLVRDRKHGRRLALKLLDPAVGLAVGGERFHREIALLARLHHPHILPLHDSGAAAGSLYYLMPFVDGESVRERLERAGPLPVAEALAIAADVADALAYAHTHGVVHRDVKPENVLLSDGHAVVCDFGIARLVGRDAHLGFGATGERHTAAGVAVGTAPYMSPEQEAGSRDVDGRADVYALGVVLYEMLTGAPPHAGESPREALARRLDGRPPRARRVRRDVPRRVDAVIARALAFQPADRFATAAEMAAALRTCLARAGERSWIARLLGGWK